jgi:hypothetical protein
MPGYSVTGPLSPEQIADRPLEPPNPLHAEALGTKAYGSRVTVWRSPILPIELYAGALEVTAVPTTGPDIAVTMEIAAVDPVDGRQAA